MSDPLRDSTYAPDERRPPKTAQVGWNEGSPNWIEWDQAQLRAGAEAFERVLAEKESQRAANEQAMVQAQAERDRMELENEALTARVHLLEDTIRRLAPYQDFFNVVKFLTTPNKG